MLEIRKLVKVYPGPVAALGGVDLAVPRGLFGLLGPNGAGKTTLLSILAGLLEPTSGSVRFDDVDVVARPEAIRSRLGYLPQSFGFYPSLSGAAMLRHLLRLKGVEAPGGLESLVEGLLERVNLGDVANRPVKSYSGGMRQRLGIAQAIAGDPELLIVDEPTVGLDPEERNRFHALLAELGEQRTILLSTHLVEDVATLCPRFAVIREGKVLATTTPAEARDDLAGRIFEGEVTREELGGLELRHPPLRSFHVEGRHRVRLLVDRGEPPRGFLPAPPTLEDAYLSLVRTAGAGETGARAVAEAGA